MPRTATRLAQILLTCILVMIDLHNLAKEMSYGGPAYPVADHVAFLSGELFFDVLLLSAVWWVPWRFGRR